VELFPVSRRGGVGSGITAVFLHRPRERKSRTRFPTIVGLSGFVSG
jgi:hypothetical protein